MAPYFDITDAGDKALLPLDSQTATNVAVYAGEAEADVIAFYTRPVPVQTGDPWTWPFWWDTWPSGIAPFTDLGNQTGVFLAGYFVDSGDANPGFVAAMKRTIARVIVWRLGQESHDPATTSEMKAGSTSRTYTRFHDAPFPRNWDRELRHYDTRIPAWGL